MHGHLLSHNNPSHCVGVQDVDVSHGVPTPPLYFRDGSLVLLSDDRYYDMCILRIDCPDSDDHIIWFLEKVEVDPESDEGGDEGGGGASC